MKEGQITPSELPPGFHQILQYLFCVDQSHSDLLYSYVSYIRATRERTNNGARFSSLT